MLGGKEEVGRGGEREGGREGVDAWMYMPKHSASRAQGHVHTQGDDTCTGYQILWDNTRDAGRRTGRPQLSRSLTHTCVALCSYSTVTIPPETNSNDFGVFWN